MDSITQALLGAVVGEAVLGRHLGWRGAVYGAAFGTLPDLDILFMPFMDQVQRVYWHRGISHSVPMMILASFLFGSLLSKWWQWWKRPVNFYHAAVFVFLAWSTHVLIDCFTTYGTSLWSPFSSDREWWNIMFIIDPLFTLPMVAGLIGSWFFWRNKRHRWIPNAVGLIVSCLYVCLSFLMKTQIISPRFYEAFAAAGAEHIAIAPMPLNTILWRGIAETEDEYLVGLYSPMDSDSEIQFTRIQKNHHLIESMKDSREFQALDWFSRGVWSASEGEGEGEGGHIQLVDRRFSDMRIDGKNVAVFAWDLKSNDDGVDFQKVELDRRSANMNGQLANLWKRIWGDEEGWN